MKHVTIYAFSIDNFNRSEAEVNTLFEILREKLLALSTHEGSYARINKIRVRIIGKKSLIPEDILRDLENIEKNTRNNISDRVLNVCFPYTSREEITHAMQEVAEKVCNKEITNVKGEDSPITIKLLHDQMYMSGETTPPLDLLIRTSGHTRLSDFMLWQCNSNCTIEFVNTLWPDFKFLGISSLLLKWMYYKTLQLEEKQAVSSSTDRIFQP